MHSEAMIERAARRFGLLADPTRLRIVHVLMDEGELSVGRLAGLAGTSRFNVSAHLGRLAEGGMVGRRREGTTVYYRIVDEGLPAVCDWMCQSVRDHAERVATS